MGSTNSSLSQKDSLPNHLAFTECKEILTDTKQLLAQNKAELRLNLQIYLPSFKYHQQNWKQSRVIGDLSNFGLSKGELPQVQEITMDMEQVFRMHALLKHFRKAKQQEERVTVGGQAAEGKECCICLDEKANMVLPCGHSYCLICTSRYIIEQEEHKCPQCRCSFHGDPCSIEKTVYEVIEEDKILYEQARSQIIEMVAKYNSKAAYFLGLEQRENLAK